MQPTDCVSSRPPAVRELMRRRVRIVRQCTKSGRQLVVLEGFGQPARACGPGAQVGSG